MTGGYTEKRTIKKSLGSYFLQMAVVFSGLLVFSMAALLFNQLYHHREYQHLFILNDFYTNLDEMNTDYAYYTQNGGDDLCRELTERGEELLGAIDQIGEIPAGASFLRDVWDIRQVFSQYLANLDQIRQKKAAQSLAYGKDSATVIQIQKEINALQNQSGAFYEQIGGEFKNLYSQILEASQESSLRWQKVMTVCLFLLLVLTAVTFSFQIYGAFYWADQISSPLVALARRARAIMEKGWEADYGEIPASGITNVETETLVQGFDEMISQLKKSTREREARLRTELELKEKKVENLRIQKELKTNQLKLLQAQINPHFLFNTLNSVSQTAYLEKAGKTVEMLGRTAALLRYYLDFSDKTVTLGKEAEELKNYGELQQARFKNRIDLIIEIQPSCETCLVPSNILQPLVENSIIHGVGGYDRGGRIIVEAQTLEEQDFLVIRVTDNGMGMTEEQIENLDRLLKSGMNTGKHIGLGNVNQKLRWYFGEKARITVFSDPGVETRICLIIPRREAESNRKPVM